MAKKINARSGGNSENSLENTSHCFVKYFRSHHYMYIRE